MHAQRSVRTDRFWSHRTDSHATPQADQQACQLHELVVHGSRCILNLEDSSTCSMGSLKMGAGWLSTSSPRWVKPEVHFGRTTERKACLRWHSHV